MRSRRTIPILVEIVPLLVIIVVTYLAVLAFDIYRYSFCTDDLTADAAIVLGAAVWNGEPSPVFTERINHAIQLYQGHQVQKIIFTGGVGQNDQIAEATAARGYAVQRGVAEQDIFGETRSKITEENLQSARKVVQQLGLNRVLIVSDPLHMRRSVTIARDLGMDAYPSPTPTTRYRSFLPKLEFLLRETYFYGLYLLYRMFSNYEQQIAS